MISVNNHIHTKYSDGNNNIKEMIEAAKNKGLGVITITDHFQSPIVGEFIDFNKVLKLNKLSEYIAKINSIQVNGIKFLTGLEIDYLPKAEEEISKIVNESELDFALCGIHNTEKYSIDLTPELYDKIIEIYGNMKEFYLDYFNHLAKAIQSGIFDCIAHLDLIKIFNVDNKYFRENEEEYVNAVDNCLDLIREKEIAIELNTKGFDKPIGKQYPSEWILKKSFDKGIDISVGGDSHNIDQILRHYDKAEELLRKIGYNRIVYFENRGKNYIELK